MVKYNTLGYSTFEDYFEDFMKTLLPTNKTYEYFVDWEKVRSFANRYTAELDFLKELYGVDRDTAKSILKRTIEKHPSVLQVIPSLIAERAVRGKIDVYDPSKMKFLEFNFRPHMVSDSEADAIIEFCEKSGVLDILTSVKNLHEYLLGVEVGMDTNSRKGRSGLLFENMVKSVIEGNVPDYVKVVPQDHNFSLYENIGKTRGKAKRHDLVIYKDNEPIVAIEVNFYNTTGSKPTEIVGSYITLNRVAKEKGVTFVWITDGPAWKKMKEPLKRGMKEIDWVVNYSQLPRLLAYFSSIKWEMTRL
ncbi:MAG: type restriction enzyme [Thermococcaceae archaeon]|nr:type restriction enzyme [Thermococcaceae archaeon]